MPEPKDGGRRKRARERVFNTVSIAVLIFIPIFLASTRAFDEQGLWSFVYRFHDDYYLWAKGNLYTRHYPRSLILCGFGFTIFVSWLVFYFRLRSGSIRWHVKWISRAAGRKYLHKYLLAAVYWLKRFGFEQKMIYETVGRDRIVALNRLSASLPRQAGFEVCSKAVELTVLYIDLLLVYRPEQGDHIHSAVCFHEAYFYLRRCGDEKAEWFPALSKCLTDLPDRILQPFLDTGEGRELENTLERPAGLDMESLSADLLLLASIPGARGDVKESAVNRLMRSVDGRRNMLNEICSFFEASAFGKKGVSVRTGVPECLGRLRGRLDELEALGKLTLRTALDFSAISETPETALTFIESFECLSFFADMIKKDTNTGASEMAHRVSAFVGELPHFDDYRICAELSSSKLAERKREWKQSRFSSLGVVSEEDFLLAKKRVESFYHAVGPNPGKGE